MTKNSAGLDDQAVSALDPVHARERRSDAELIEVVAGHAAGNLARLSLEQGESLHELLHRGGTRHWPLEIRKVLDAATTLVRRADRGRPTPKRFDGPKRIASTCGDSTCRQAWSTSERCWWTQGTSCCGRPSWGSAPPRWRRVDKKAPARQRTDMPSCDLAQPPVGRPHSQRDGLRRVEGHRRGRQAVRSRTSGSPDRDMAGRPLVESGREQYPDVLDATPATQPNPRAPASAGCWCPGPMRRGRRRPLSGQDRPHHRGPQSDPVSAQARRFRLRPEL